MTKQLIYMEVKDFIATIYINRPEKRNAINVSMWKELIRLVDECDQREDVSILILRSTHIEAFSAGADIGEFKDVRNSIENGTEYNQLPIILEDKLMKSSKPSIAMIQGYCVGGGCEIAIACDFRFTDESGKFGITPAKLGIVYPFSSTKNLVDLVGPSNAKDILFSGRLFGASEAVRMGLVNQIFEASKLEEKTYDYARTLVKNAALTIKGAKLAIEEVLSGRTEESEDIKELILQSFVSLDYRNRVNAFINKRNSKEG